MTDDLNLGLVRTFRVLAGCLSFTETARRLRMSQSAVSAHVRRLESVLETSLFTRDTHTVALTNAGEQFLGYAQRLLDLQDEALQVVSALPQRGLVRFGVSEDFALTHLPTFLDRFRRTHPLVDLELTIELSVVLHRRLRSGELDAVLAMRPNATSGTATLSSWPLFDDRLVWISRPGFALPEGDPVPLILYPRPSLTREIALESLARAGRSHRTAATSGSLSGLQVAALGGLGVLPFAASLIPTGLTESIAALPALPSVTFVLTTRRVTMSPATRALLQALQDDHHEFGSH